MDAKQKGTSNNLPENGLLRIWQIIGSKKRNIPPILPISRSTFYAGIKSGKFPRPILIGSRIACWDVNQIRKIIERATTQ